ncbi:MAG TPA: hypothetical protein VK188_03670 [Holophaga sp.]|nr:hypothetical protein [Holophaga sp.]
MPRFTNPFLAAAAAIALPLAAQGPVDLNGLASSADRYLSHKLQASPYPISRDLILMRGDNGGDEAHLMGRTVDVKRWTIFYNVEASGPSSETLPRSASVKCQKGVFGEYLTSPKPVLYCKSIQDTWLAVNLDSAIQQLNAHGYTRGFSRVEIKRPDRPGFSDELAYVFTCPWERAHVAISASTGAYIWFQAY